MRFRLSIRKSSGSGWLAVSRPRIRCTVGRAVIRDNKHAGRRRRTEHTWYDESALDGWPILPTSERLPQPPKPGVAGRLNFSSQLRGFAGAEAKPQEGGSVMLGIGLGYGSFAVLVILVVCLWAVPF
jgi:hypothetical protein